MNNLFFLLILFLLLPLKVVSQDSSGYIQYIYQGKMVPEAENLTDFNAELYFDSNKSIFIYGKIGMNANSDLGQMNTYESNVNYVQSSESEKGKMIFRNFKTKEIIYNELKLGVFKPYTVIDNWVTMEWKIDSTSTKVVAGYTTTKATTQFRGTNYTAWFSEDIPLPYGPLKLFGLSGVILELITHDIDNRDIKFTAKEVCYPCELPIKIEAPQEKITKTIEEEVHFRDNFQYYFVSEMNNVFKNKGIWFLDHIPTEKSILNKRKSMPEKFYEWEDKNTKRLLQGINYKKLLDPTLQKRKKDQPQSPFKNHFRN